MTIVEQINNDLTAARKDGRTADRDALVFLLAEVRGVGKKKANRDTTDEEAITHIRTLVAGCVESIAALQGTPRAGGAEEDKLAADMRRMMAYLPQQLSEAKLTEMISAFVDGQAWPDKTQKRVGEIMAHLKAEVPGQFDPKMASTVARTLLGL